MSKLATCRRCGLTFVPSFTFDFYPDGEDPNVGLCEKCVIDEALGKPKITSNDPVPLPAGYEKTVCKRGRRSLTCSFIGMTGDGFRCLKGSTLESEINRRRAEGSMGAKGDNCSGPPDFTVRTNPAG